MMTSYHAGFTTLILLHLRNDAVSVQWRHEDALLARRQMEPALVSGELPRLRHRFEQPSATLMSASPMRFGSTARPFRRNRFGAMPRSCRLPVVRGTRRPRLGGQMLLAIVLGTMADNGSPIHRRGHRLLRDPDPFPPAARPVPRPRLAACGLPPPSPGRRARAASLSAATVSRRTRARRGLRGTWLRKARGGLLVELGGEVAAGLSADKESLSPGAM